MPRRTAAAAGAAGLEQALRDHAEPDLNAVGDQLFGALAADFLTFLVPGQVWWTVDAGLAFMTIRIFIQAGRAPIGKRSAPPSTRQLRRQQERLRPERAGR